MVTRNDATRIIDAIDSRIKRLTRSLAMVDTTWGEVAAVDSGESTVDVLLYGSPYASEDFRIIGGGLPEVGDSVKVAIDKRTGDRWIMEPLFAAAPGSGVTSHDDLTGVSANDHHAQVHSIDGADHSGSLDADQIGVTPFGTIAATDVQAALEEVYGEASGGTDLTVEDSDASVSVSSVDKIIFDDGLVQDLGSGDVRVRGLPTGTIGAKAYATAITTLTSAGTFYPVTLGGEQFDTDGFHSTVTNTSRMTIPAGLAGKYLAIAQVAFNNITTGERVIEIGKNGSFGSGLYAWSRDNNSNNSGDMTRGCLGVIDLVAGDYVEIGVYSSVTGVTTVGNIHTSLTLIKLDSGRVGTGIGARVYAAGTQSISDDTVTVVTFDTEETDPHGFHSTAANTERFTCPAGLGGKYLVAGHVGYVTPDADGRRRLAIFKNDTVVRGASVEQAGSATVGGSQELIVSAIVELVPGDFVDLRAYQNSGAAMNIGTATDPSGTKSTFEIVRLDSLPPAEQGTWQSYTPTLTAVTTNPTIGNGSLSGRWKYIDNKTIAIRVYFAFGSTSNAGSGLWSFALPPGIACSASGGSQILPGLLVDQGTSYYQATALLASSGIKSAALVVSRRDNEATATAAQGISHNTPMTWATGDEVTFEGILEIA